MGLDLRRHQHFARPAREQTCWSAPTPGGATTGLCRPKGVEWMFHVKQLVHLLGTPNCPWNASNGLSPSRRKPRTVAIAVPIECARPAKLRLVIPLEATTLTKTSLPPQALHAWFTTPPTRPPTAIRRGGGVAGVTKYATLWRVTPRPTATSE